VELRQALRRVAGFVSLGGVLYAALVLLARGPVDHVLFGTLGPAIGRSLVWLAPVVPVNLLVLLMAYTLAAASTTYRRWVAIAYFAGAAFNLGVLLATVHAHPEVAGALGAAVGIVTTALVLSGCFRSLMRSLDRPDSDRSPALYRATEH
jgi:hypothetical protein